MIPEKQYLDVSFFLPFVFEFDYTIPQLCLFFSSSFVPPCFELLSFCCRHTMAQLPTALLKHLPHLACLSIIVPLHLLGRDASAPELAEPLVPSMMLLPVGRGRAERKQNRTSSDLSGEQPLSSFLPSGRKAPKEALSLSPSLLLSRRALPWPCSTLSGACSPLLILLFPSVTLNQTVMDVTL